MRISDWSSDVCSSDLVAVEVAGLGQHGPAALVERGAGGGQRQRPHRAVEQRAADRLFEVADDLRHARLGETELAGGRGHAARSEEHTSELQSLMRISYAVFCLKKKKHIHTPKHSMLN